MQRRTILSGLGVSLLSGLSGCTGFLSEPAKSEATTKNDTMTPTPTDDETDNIVAAFEGEGSTVTDAFNEAGKTILIFDIENRPWGENFAVYLRPAENTDNTKDRLIVSTTGSVDGSFTLAVDEKSQAVIEASESTSWSVQVRRLEVVTTGN
jgi:hypothetical protein